MGAINLKYLKYKGFSSNIEKDVLGNGYFQKVLYIGKYSQLVLMGIKPNEEIGIEVHLDNDQFFALKKVKESVLLTEMNTNQLTVW